eukprot:6585563-Pyramimonas_sp.AAC.1
MIQKNLSWRFRGLGWQHIRDHEDISTTFGSTDWAHHASASGGTMKSQEAKYGEQRFQTSAVASQGLDESLFAKPHAGALQGGPWAVKVFTRVNGTVFEQTQDEFIGSEEIAADWCIVGSPPAEEDEEPIEIDPPFHAYVDDATQTSVSAASAAQSHEEL